ncbi:MAG: uncharacterized membrane protein (DUF485 family), partial [Bacillariaceae sp.]
MHAAKVVCIINERRKRCSVLGGTTFNILYTSYIVLVTYSNLIVTRFQHNNYSNWAFEIGLHMMHTL